MNETQLVTRMKKYIKTVDKTMVIKHHGGPFSQPGVSDLLICWESMFVAIEVKTPESGNGPTDLQMKFLLDVIDAGGIAFCATSVFDIKEFFESGRFPGAWAQLNKYWIHQDIRRKS